MKQIIFVKVLKVIPGKDSTDINKVSFMVFVAIRKYLKTTLRRPSFVMAINSTDINKVCFMEFVSMRKYLKTTLKRPSFVMGISV